MSEYETRKEINRQTIDRLTDYPTYRHGHTDRHTDTQTRRQTKSKGGTCVKTCTRKYEKEGFGREGENEKEAEGEGGRGEERGGVAC